jgi:hypothetical protein
MESSEEVRMILTPKNWSSFQHYKDRAPAWIKLHKGLLNDYAFACLPVASRALAPLLWLLASEYEEGKIEGSLQEFAFRLHMTEGDLAEALNPLIEAGFFAVDSTSLAERSQPASLEKRREQDKTETEKKVGADAPPSSGGIFFESGVIRLTRKDYEKWRDAFSNLDLKAELIGLTEWAAGQESWFFAVSSALAKKNREMGLRREGVRMLETKPQRGIPGIL